MAYEWFLIFSCLRVIAGESIDECLCTRSLSVFNSVDTTVVFTGLLVNQPKLSPCATWQENASTFADAATVQVPHAIFINTNNTVHIASSLQFVYVWREGDTSPPHSSKPSFAGTDNGASVTKLYQWPVNAPSSPSVSSTTNICFALFIDDVNRLYCSMSSINIVRRKVLNDTMGTSIAVAGDGTIGNTSDRLNSPIGIFVTANCTLYVADGNNGRIQLFPPEQMNATTVAGVGAPGTVVLAGPIGVVLDAEGYMFILEYYKNRIVGQGPYGFRCIAACSNSSGSAPNQLRGPFGLSFDSHGNIFVVDQDNNRTQKFLLATNSCGKWTREERMPTNLIMFTQ